MKKIIKPIQQQQQQQKTNQKILQLKSHLNKWLFIIIKILFLFQKKYF